jgi:hypothetical protein
MSEHKEGEDFGGDVTNELPLLEITVTDLVEGLQQAPCSLGYRIL